MENKKIMYTATATSEGGREGHVRTADGVLDLDLRPPVEMGGPGGAANPEMLFAAGYSACFNSALARIAMLERKEIGPSKVTVSIDLIRVPDGTFRLGATIDVEVPGVSQEEAEQLAEKAHHLCPYSLATKGNIEAKLNAKAV